MSHDYSPILLTEKLKVELEAIVAQQPENPNLALAITTFIDAAMKPILTLPSVIIQQQINAMDTNQLRAELMVMIDSFKEVTGAGAALLLAAAQQRMVARSATARAAVAAKKKKDPKQAAKNKAHELWLDWKAGKHPHIKTTEQFATAVMRQSPVLESSANICKWSAKWGKERRL